ncbi:OB-fold-containig protein [Anabaena sp. CS-542/02]|uniref:OB-fold-containig protein n=1 Tax=Anabaena sp. CS-542/02 TaxID=3021719 RepID=UPI00232D3D15|nr:OB-fold-containig protein [Anabaena sp. CS-542/02]MDB9446877.1 DUF1449 family protein [Anabaena sp. CS-542/02]
MLFNPANLPYWIFLGMGILLFVFLIISIGGDGDVEYDDDIDIQVNLDQLLGWTGIGKAPLILLLATDLSLWGILGLILNSWAISLSKGNLSGFISGTVLLISLIISLLLGRLIAQVIGKIFAEFGEDTSKERLIGCLGTVTSFYIPSEQEGKIGQIDILDGKSNFLTISAVLPKWATVSPKRGETVIVIEINQQNYVVIAHKSRDEELWLANSINRDKN